MSNFIKNTKHPKTGKFEAAYWLDDYYGLHHYAVKFKDGTLIDTWEQEVETNQDEPVNGVTWEDYLAAIKRKEDE